MNESQVFSLGRRGTQRAWLIMLVALGNACGDNLGPLSNAVQPDASSPPDATAGIDASSPTDASTGIDATLEVDATPDEDIVDASPNDGPRPPANIDLARAVSDGPVNIQISRVFVTYTKPAVVNEPAGFFIQADPQGPALFIQVDPATLAQNLQVGALVSFRILEMETNDYQRRALQIADLVVHAYEELPSSFTQNVSEAAYLVSDVDAYESELISARVAILTNFGSFDGHHSRAQAATSVITDDLRLLFALPNALQNDLHLVAGCVIDIGQTPLWRFRSEAHLHIWALTDITAANCPSANVIDAIAVSPTQVRVLFDRAIDPASISNPNTQFSFGSNLIAQSAQVTGTTVLLTTNTQDEGRLYELSVTSTVRDVLGIPVNESAGPVEFLGFAPPAALKINEIKANAPGGCDLLELRVIAGGSMDGVRIFHENKTMLEFRNFRVGNGALIVVHSAPAAAGCNPDSSSDEHTSPVEYPESDFAGNFDSAYDWYTSAPLSSLPSVITVVDVNGEILDGALFTTSETNSFIPAKSEIQAAILAEADEWRIVGGGVPKDGFVGLDFSLHAAPGLLDSGSIARRDDSDNDDKSDWTITDGNTMTFGATNPGQGVIPTLQRF